jgi:hypothetical protein
MSFADRLPPFARLEVLGKYQAEGRLVAAGFLAGLVLFLAWWAFQPSLGTRAGATAVAAGATSTTPAIGGGNGVLDGITGAPEPGRGELQDAVPDERAAADAETPDNGDMLAPDDAIPGAAPDADAVAPPAPGDDGAADAMPMPNAPDAASVHPYYVEVERGPGVSEVLRIDATSPEQVLVILRDYRGDPQVLRGPSPQPLD